jgi:HSP20 family molecular chaperone IbpA
MKSIREALEALPDALFADLLESADAYLIVLDIPGATAETLEVRADETRLEIEASREKAVPDGFEFRSEGRPLFFDATIPLPPSVSGEAVSARIDKGVLEIELPKTDAGWRDVPIEG